MTKAILKTRDIYNALRSDGSFNILVKCLRATDLVKLLADTDRTFTLFAPNEQAFKKLVPGDRLKDLLKDKDLLNSVIRHHIIPGPKIDSNHVGGVIQLQPMDGSPLVISNTGPFLVGNANVLRADIECENGLIHEIDSVIFPGDRLV